MKGNIKRLALLAIITIIATFMIADTVTAESSKHGSIWGQFWSPIDITGQYAATGSGTCLVAFGGFDVNGVPKPTPPGPPGTYDLVTATVEAVFKFYSNGKGVVTRTNPTIDHTNPSLALTEDGWKFKYKVKHDGSITLTQLCQPGVPTGIYKLGGPPVPGGFVYYNNNRNWRGTVSPDGKTIILNAGYPDIIKNIDPDSDKCAVLDDPTEIVCNISAVLIWQHDIRWGWNHDQDDDDDLCDDHRR